MKRLLNSEDCRNSIEVGERGGVGCKDPDLPVFPEEIEEAVKNLYKPKIKPDAIFTASDRITTVCLDVLKRKQKTEVGLIGFTNTNLGDLFLTPLSVIRQPAFEIGQNATELLIQLIESKRESCLSFLFFCAPNPLKGKCKVNAFLKLPL